MTKARDTANLVATGVPNSLITLDAAEIPNISTDKLTSGTLANARVADLPTSKITSGTFADARISSSSVVQHSPETDLQPIKSDLTALALREATNEASAAFNLPNQFIETFTDDTNLGTQTDGDRNATFGYWSTISSSSAITMTPNSAPNISRSTTQKKFGSYSLDTTANATDNLYFIQSPQFSTIAGTRVRTGNFTFEYWYRYTSHSGTDRHFAFGPTSQTSDPPTLSFAWNATTGTSTYYPNSVDVSATYPARDTGVWHHHAFQRDGSTCYRWLDGVVMPSFAMSDDLMPDTDTFILGCRHGNSTETFEGHMDDVRLSNIKRYTNSVAFTPHTSAHVIDSDTCFLLNFETDYSDNGSVAVASATGTLIQSANAVGGSDKTKVGGTMLYKDNAGTNTLGTDLKIYLTANGGSNWTEAASYNAITPVYSTGVKQVRLGETTVTGGTDVRYKAVWANQAASSKETQLHGIGINY